MTTVSHNTASVQMLTLVRFGGMTPRMLGPLFHRFGSLAAILGASATELLSVSGITKTAAAKLSKAHNHLYEATSILDELGRRDIRLLTHFDPDYGTLLTELNDPPPMLYLRGNMPDPAKKSVTLVGTEAATELGIALTTRLAKLFAEAGVQVVSSLTLGSDAAAHLGARSVNGQSFAVIDTGFDHILQTEGVPLAIDVTRGGGVITEFPPEFHLRDDALETTNRILVGLGQAVVITEVYQSSRRIHDIIDFCSQIGKLSFLMVDPDYGPLADKESLEHALRCGVIPMEGLDKSSDIIKVLV
ncbi:MAG: DNA-processing protein DprA [bacterium]|nr:DNA-processing protein DprA [bacterium]